MIKGSMVMQNIEFLFLLEIIYIWYFLCQFSHVNNYNSIVIASIMIVLWHRFFVL